MKKIIATLLCCSFAAACNSSKAPTGPSATNAPGVLAGFEPNAFGQPAVFGASVADFARCLHGQPDAACFSASRVGVRGGFQVKATAPGTPGTLTAVSSGSTVTLTWSAPSSGDAPSTYVIEAGSAPGLSNLANFATGSTATTFSATGIGNGTYYVRVRAQNGAGVSGTSNEATLVVGAVGCAGAPGAPTSLTVGETGGTVTLTWGAPAGGCPVTSYVLQAGSAPGLSNLANSSVGAVTSYVATGVGAGTYYIRVVAQNAAGTSAASNEVVLTVGGGGTTTGTISVISSTTAALFSTAFSSACSSTSTGHWSYTDTIRAGGVGVTVTGYSSAMDGAVIAQGATNYVIPANGSRGPLSFTWCWRGTPIGHTIQTTWTGVDARGNAFSYVGEAVTLLGASVTKSNYRHFPATWVSASWIGGATGTPLSSRGIDPASPFGNLCPANSLTLKNHQGGSFFHADDSLFATNTGCSFAMTTVAFCRTSGSGGGASDIPICATDPRETPFSNLTIMAVSRLGVGTWIGTTPINFDVNVLWCSDQSFMNFGNVPSLGQTECIER